MRGHFNLIYNLPFRDCCWLYRLRFVLGLDFLEHTQHTSCILLQFRNILNIFFTPSPFIIEVYSSLSLYEIRFLTLNELVRLRNFFWISSVGIYVHNGIIEKFYSAPLRMKLYKRANGKCSAGITWHLQGSDVWLSDSSIKRWSEKGRERHMWLDIFPCNKC